MDPYYGPRPSQLKAPDQRERSIVELVGLAFAGGLALGVLLGALVASRLLAEAEIAASAPENTTAEFTSVPSPAATMLPRYPTTIVEEYSLPAIETVPPTPPFGGQPQYLPVPTPFTPLPTQGAYANPGATPRPRAPGEGPCPFPTYHLSPDEFVRAGNYSIWCYLVTRDLNGLVAFINYDSRTVDALYEYVNANRQLARELSAVATSRPMFVLVTFKQPVALSEFSTWAMVYNASVEEATLKERSGGVYVVPGTGSQQEPISMHDPSLYEGVVSARMRVFADQLVSLSTDPAVFLADVTPVVVRRELIQAGVADARQATFSIDSPYERMEALGVENFRR